MKSIHILIVFLALLVQCATSQPVPTGFPVLTFGPSPVDNGMGSLSTFRLAEDPFAVIQNPAYLGLASPSFAFRGGFFSPRTDWLPGFASAGLRFGVQSASAGSDLAPSIGFPLVVGLGYSHVRLDLGEFALTSSDSPESFRTISAYEMANDYSIGIGADIGIRLAAGVTLRHLETNISDRTSSTNAYSVGFLSSLPVHALIPALAGNDAIVPSIHWTLDVSAGLVFANYGDSINYGTASDPLPRMVSTGLCVEFGLRTASIGGGLKIIGAALTRSARELLVTRDTSGRFHYVSGLGHLDFVSNVVRGIRSEPVILAKGWEVSILELFALRGGSFTEGAPLSYETTGWSLRSAGLFKILGALTESDLLTAIGVQVDVRYDSGKEKNSFPDNPRDGTSYSALSFRVQF